MRHPFSPCRMDFVTNAIRAVVPMIVVALPLTYPLRADTPTSVRESEPKTFADLVASVAQPPAPETLSPAETARLDYCVSDAAVRIRKDEVLAKASFIRPDNRPSGKQSLRVD